MSQPTRVLVTGSAGFIGSHTIKYLEERGHVVCGVDSFTSYYNPEMKFARETSMRLSSVTRRLDILDEDRLQEVFLSFQPEVVIHFAAQAGVRASQDEPLPYLRDNQVGFLNVLRLSKKHGVRRLLFASSSSVYGDTQEPPFSEDSPLASPKSLYALSKISNEILARDSGDPGMTVLGLRLFTVYGPWGRPDMAVFRTLASAVLEKPFQLSASLQVKRDFTYVSDVTRVVEQLTDLSRTWPRYDILNVAGGRPHSLSELFECVRNQGLNLRVEQTSVSQLDVGLTHASVEKLKSFGIEPPSTRLTEGVSETIEWLKHVQVDDLAKWFEYRRAV